MPTEVLDAALGVVLREFSPEFGERTCRRVIQHAKVCVSLHGRKPQDPRLKLYRLVKSQRDCDRRCVSTLTRRIGRSYYEQMFVLPLFGLGQKYVCAISAWSFIAFR